MAYRDPESDKAAAVVFTGLAGGCGLLLVLLCAAGLWGCPQYNVYSERLAGEAALARAEAERQVRVADANARLEASKMLADAEVAQAEGAAKANAALVDGLGGPDNYIRWRYIQMLEKNAEEGNDVTVIYVPTEGQIPIMEAGAAYLQ